MNANEIGNFQKESISGHRPTWKFGVGAMAYHNMEEVRRRIFENFIGSQRNDYRSAEDNHAFARLAKPVRDALKALNLSYPVTLQEIKKRYKQLAKEYHPDLNNTVDDSKIKTINHAYNVLKNVDIFK